MEDTRLGAILLDYRVVPEKDLQHCLEIQALAGGQRPLGQILVEQGVITQRTLDDLLLLQEARRLVECSPTVIEGEDVDRYLRAAVQAGANQLHLSEGRHALIRVAGGMQTLGDTVVSGPELWQFVRVHMGNEVLEAVAERHSVTREFHYDGLARGRITAFRHFDGLAVSVHLHPEAVRTPQEAGIEKSLLESVRHGKGLILVIGEHGSGITETLATLVHEASSVSGRLVLVIDETFEYPRPTGGAIVSMRRVGEHTRSHATGIRAALREDPDVVVIGETDFEAFNLALHAAESGRLVIACVRARSVVTALERVLRYYPSYDEDRIRCVLAAILIGAITVRLVPAQDHSGQIIATEVLRFDESVRDLVRLGSLRQINALIRLENAAIGHSMDRSLLRLLESGSVRFEDVFQHADDKSLLLQSHQSTRRRKT